MEWLEWLKIGAPIVTLIVTGLVTLAAYFGKKMIDGFSDELRGMRTDHEALEKDFLRFQAHLPRVYVLKDDHIRHVTILEKKIDDLGVSVQTQLQTINSDVKVLLREIPKRSSDGKT